MGTFHWTVWFCFFRLWYRDICFWQLRPTFRLLLHHVCFNSLTTVTTDVTQELAAYSLRHRHRCFNCVPGSSFLNVCLYLKDLVWWPRLSTLNRLNEGCDCFRITVCIIWYCYKQHNFSVWFIYSVTVIGNEYITMKKAYLANSQILLVKYSWQIKKKIFGSFHPNGFLSGKSWITCH